MTVQTVPYALQNASHSAALFRQAQSAAFVTSGALGAAELAVAQQASPNMSVLLGAGRAKVLGSSVSPPAGQSWTTQAMYDTLNDAPVTLTIAASNPSNPRIDLVYIQVQDSFYSGAANQAVSGVVTGTPAASPVVPATPTNAVAIATIAVAAGTTSIVNANIARVVPAARLIGGSVSVVDLDALAALTGFDEPTQAWVDALNVMFTYDSGTWVQSGIATATDISAANTEYAKAGSAYVVPGARVYLTTPHVLMQVNGGGVFSVLAMGSTVTPTSAVNGTIQGGGRVGFSGVTSVSLNGAFDNSLSQNAIYMIVIYITAASASTNPAFKFRQSGTDVSTGYNYGGQQISSATPTVLFSASTTSFSCMRSNTTTGGAATLTVSGATSNTTKVITSVGGDTTAGFQNSGGCTLATSADGFSIIPSSGTISGNVTVYVLSNGS